MRARKICGHAHCPELQPCPVHRRKPWEKKPGSEPERLRGRKATKRRRYVLKRDEFTCHLCGQVRLAADLVADHVVPLAQGGPDTTANLRACCRDCHTLKTLEEAKAGRA